MPAWINAGFNEYAKRLEHGNIKIKLIEIGAIKRTKTCNIERVKQQEQQKILAKILPQSLIIALDNRGNQLNTLQLAKNLKNWQQEYKNMSLLIGGADGLSQQCLQSSHLVWSLSKLTFPHQLVRVIVVEQIYRAWTILNKHPYHR